MACRACSPRQEQEHGDKEQEEQRQEQNEKNQEHLKVCPGYAEIWSGLCPATEESRVFYENKDKETEAAEQREYVKNKQ